MVERVSTWVRPQSFSISNGVENAVVNLEGFDENSAIQDLQIAMNKALDLNGFDEDYDFCKLMGQCVLFLLTLILLS